MDTLNKIIKACFEGLFGTMIGGLVIFTLQSMRKNRRILFIAVILLAGMFGWRLFLVNRFISPRYAASFLFPAILFTTFMMVKFKKWWWVLTVIFCIICCCKIFRTTPTGGLVSRTAAFIAADAANRKNPIIFLKSVDARRMKFYSGIDSRSFGNRKNYEEAVRYVVWRIKINPKSEVIYLCYDMPSGEVISPDHLKGLNGSWQLIRSVPRNRKKKVDLHCYRFLRNETK